MKYIYKIPKSITINEEKDGKSEQVDMETCLEGEIHLNLPGFAQLPVIGKEFEQKMSENKTDSNYQLSVIVDFLNRHVEKVNAKSGDLTFECLDDLACVVEGRALAMSLIGMITRGIQLGEAKKA